MKKSVVAITQSSSDICHTAASSEVSIPTRSCGNSVATCPRQELLQHGRRELAATSTAMRQFRELDRRQFRAKIVHPNFSPDRDYGRTLSRSAESVGICLSLDRVVTT
jgi:hypothetical protein